MKNWKEVKSWPDGHRVCRACDKLKADGDFHTLKNNGSLEEFKLLVAHLEL